MDINKAFHPFDIRGNYPEVVDEQMASLIGQYVRSYLDGQIIIASDNRESSPKLRHALGVGVDLGELPTPLFYYAVCKLGSTGGIMVTASHVYSAQNGFKIVHANALPFNEGEILELKTFVERHSGKAEGRIQNPQERIPDSAGMTTLYISEIVQRFKGLRCNKKIIFDSGQTVATPIIKEILSRLSLNYELLTTNRGLNPLIEEGYKNVCEAVIREKADLGVLWDGDCDRVVFIDKTGKLIPQSYILGIIAKNYKKAAFDMRAGLAAYTTDYILTPSWAQNLKYAMQDDPKIGFAGEVSGHLIFREWYGIDDGIFGALKFIELMGDLDIKSDYIDIIEENFEYKSDPALVLDKIANYYRSKDFLVSVLDGVTVSTGEFHLNIRQSLTEPFLRLNLEARTQKKLDEIQNEIKTLIGS
ncbi:MAG: hypothetical protein Q7S14_01090 [bacterium]|nr:hypothetical protein [bacterium]